MRRFGIALGVSTRLVLLAGCKEAPSEPMMGPPTEPPSPSAALIEAAPISITDLGTLGGTEVASGINDAGEIVGNSKNASGVRRAVRWAPDGTITDLGTFLGGLDSRAGRVNSFGRVVGWARTASGDDHAFEQLGG